GPVVIGAEAADPAEYPATFVFATRGGRCSATAVGTETILTAAHCVAHRGSGVVKLSDDTSIALTCDHHPGYTLNRTKDFALCRAAAPLAGLLFERVNTSIAFPKRGDEVRLLGFGCREEGGADGAFGALYTGRATVIGLPTGRSLDTVTQGGAALCFGDSGGGAYVELNSDGSDRALFGVNSRGDISDTSYLSTTATKDFLNFAVDWAKENQTTICGVHAAAASCR
ncbi:MAG: trypsin-like serine protease, partial [Pseudomonadota bacterium]